MIRRTPWANYGLMAVNIFLFMVMMGDGRGRESSLMERYFVLDADWPAWHQFITYQFAHGDGWHLAGNMLFLWVFGNSVNAKMRNIPYLLFYLAGGVFAGLVFAWDSSDSLIGASGSIAAVTTAYLALFPRSRVTVLYIFFFIGSFEVPATLLIGLKIILWDNILAPGIASGSEGIAYSAHLGGYAFGLIAGMILLLTRAVPRDQFDLLALIKRWNQRRAFNAGMSSPEAQAKANFGRVARVARTLSPAEVVREQRMDEITELRSQIADCLTRHETSEAADLYVRLVGIDPQQCLPADQQLEIGKEFYAHGRYAPAAAAFERYIACYKHGQEANEVRLILGIIYTRELQQYEAAEKHLREAIDGFNNAARRTQAQNWLAQVQAARA